MIPLSTRDVECRCVPRTPDPQEAREERGCELGQGSSGFGGWPSPDSPRVPLPARLRPGIITLASKSHKA